MKTPIRDLMTQLPHSVGHDISISKAKTMMREHHIHHLPVLDGGKLVGVLSARDLKVAEGIPNSAEMPVEELMTDEPLIVDPDTDVKTVIETMLSKEAGSVIVSAKAGQPWGIFTSTDGLRHLIERL